MKVERKISITNTIKVFLIVLATVIFFYGCTVSKEAGEKRAIVNAAEKIEFTVVEKENEKLMYSNTKCDFVCVIKNKSNAEFDRISGAFKIMNFQGKVLSSGKASFSTYFEAKSEYEFKLTWEMDYDENSIEILESDFSKLRFSFEVEEIIYDGYEVVKVKK